MSKTARGCCSRAAREPKQHPAILPWPSAYHRYRRASARRSNRQRSGCRTYGGRFMRRHETRGTYRAQIFSTADTQPFNQLPVSPLVGAMQIVENLPPLRHELEQPAARVVVFDVGLEVIGQGVDPLGEQRNLDFRRTRITRL